MSTLSRDCRRCLRAAALAVFAAGAAAAAGSEEECRRLLAAGDAAAALPFCRAAAESGNSPQLLGLLAEAEYAAGDSRRAAALWRAILEHEGWQLQAARGLANALWRSGELQEAERLLRENLARAPGAESFLDLARFLESFDRWREQREIARQGAASFPGECRLQIAWGVAEAGLGAHAVAADRFASAVALGCGDYAWARRGAVPQSLDHAAYAELLAPAGLLAGLAELPPGEALWRLELLRRRPTDAMKQPLVELILARSERDVRQMALATLSRLVPDPAVWERLLAEGDLVVRKLALRQMREIADPALIPLLAAHLEREKAPRNRSLVLVTLGELLVAGGDETAGAQRLAEVPEEDPLRSVALLRLADLAESRGEFTRALELLEQALARDPQIFLEAGRLERLRRRAAAPP